MGALFFLMRTRKGRKRPLLTSGTAAFARRFCSEVSHSRASAENPAPIGASTEIFSSSMFGNEVFMRKAPEQFTFHTSLETTAIFAIIKLSANKTLIMRILHFTMIQSNEIGL
jgi:hypothetical protein